MPSHYYGLKLSTVVIKRRHKRLNFAKSVIELVSPVWSQVLTTCWSFNGTIQVVERLCCACVLCIVFCSYDRIFHKSITLCLPHVFWIYISSVQFCFKFFSDMRNLWKLYRFTLCICVDHEPSMYFFLKASFHLFLSEADWFVWFAWSLLSEFQSELPNLPYLVTIWSRIRDPRW